MDQANRGIWFAAQTEMGYIKEIYKPPATDWWAASDYYGYVYSLKAVVILNNNVFFGGQSGVIYVT